MNEDEKVVYFGETDARNRRLRFGIKKIDRSRHMYAIGKTGMGKSTLLENLAVQDIQNGDGLCFIDPHGKSADLLLEYVPEHRIKDVIYFAPFDMEYPISFNVMEDVGPERRYLVANGLMAAFKKIWVDAWSARMEYILGNIMLALLEYPGSTLVGVNRMLTDKDFRKEVVNNITDPSVKSFWVNEYANYTDKFAAEAAPAIQNKVGQFVANPLIRNIIGQSKSSFDIREIMDNKKILIINLSKGRVGEANANLLGSMLITKIYLAAMSRADLKEKELAAAPNFYLYVDEFQSFANESFADILSEARKYKLNLCIAHQYIEQMTEEVRAAVFGNVGTMVCYRVGAYDAEVLEKEFAPQFTAEDIVNLQKYQMYLKLMIDGVTSPPFSAAGMAPIPRPETMYVNEIIASSRSLYAQPRQKVEEEILKWIQVQFGKGGGSGGNAGGGNGGGADRSAHGGDRSHGSGERSGQRPPFSGQGSGASRNDSRPPQGQPRQDSGQRRFDDQRGDSRPPRDSRGPSQASGRPAGAGFGQQSQQRAEPRTPSQQPYSKPEGHERRPHDAAVPSSRPTVSLGALRGDRDQKNDQKTPKPENLNALRDALLSVMGASTSVADQTDQAEQVERDAAAGISVQGQVPNAPRVHADEKPAEHFTYRPGPAVQAEPMPSAAEASAPQKEVPVRTHAPKPEEQSNEVSEEELKRLLG
ncbi:MAG TPA: type IV secretion system DNA-binding domain-containing protein [Candidatus Paceibacterota bacterium]